MDKSYNPRWVEQKVQTFWQQSQTFEVSDQAGEPKSYNLCMLPYPSGDLHIGHYANYTLGDWVTRHNRYKPGINVMQPMGWDSFGLPAENAAMKHQTHPAHWTENNIQRMKLQLQSIGLAIDWSREIKTSDPEYYHWQQWLFIQMFKKGLAYRKKTNVNWDPVDQTVLANEQVVDGKGWRSGAPVQQKEINSWFLKITAYQDELTDSLDTLDQWPEQVKTMQKNWIGRSSGTEISFGLNQPNIVNEIQCYTTRVDTLMGCTYLAIAPEHPLAIEQARHDVDIQTFIQKHKHTDNKESTQSKKEKIGIATSIKVVHPITEELLPVWIASYVLMDYGSGAVMAVPAHDERDFEFAQQYGLPIKTVIEHKDSEPNHAFTGDGHLIESGAYNGLDSASARMAITKDLVAKKKGKECQQYRLRDWGVSRQRYWGCPIPIIYCDQCGAVPVPEEDLPVKLPLDITYQAHTNILKNNKGFYHTTCPQCQQPATRETDTFDTFVDSSWYFIRYLSPSAKEIAPKTVNSWLPVDLYIGGIEHAVMHLLYARFIFKVMRDLDLVDANEPFKRYFPQGMVLKDGVKMSKSKGNVVNPSDLIDHYGADTLRFYLLFTSPPEQSLEWSDSGVEGAYKFLKRVWHVAYKLKNTECPKDSIHTDTIPGIEYEIENLIAQANRDIEKLQLNTVASACMKILNSLQKLTFDQCQSHHHAAIKYIQSLLILLNPFCPHITEYLWEQLGLSEDICTQPWPKADATKIQQAQINWVVQFNGKIRLQILFDRDTDQDTIVEHIQGLPKAQTYFTDKTVRKVIFVPNRLVNFVIS